jgi:hypothetical protein
MTAPTLPRTVILTCCHPLPTTGPLCPTAGYISSMAGEPADLLALSVAYAIVAYRGNEYLVPRNAVHDRTILGLVPVQDQETQ